MANILTNGDFEAGTTGWLTNSPWTISGGVASKDSTSGGNVYQGVTLENGVTYRVTFTINSISGGAINARFINGSGANVTGGTKSDTGTYTADLVYVDHANFAINAPIATVAEIDNVILERVYDINADVATTLDDATLSSTGELASTAIEGTLTVTLDAATLDSAADLLIGGTLAATLDAATVASAASAFLAATLSATLDDATCAAIGALPITGEFAETLDDAALSSEGSLPIEGSLAATLDDATAAATALSPIVGSMATTLDDATFDSTGARVTTASLAVTLADVSLVPTGELLITGTLAATLDDATLDSSQSNLGALAVTLDSATLFAELWGTAHTPQPGDRTAIPPTFTFSSIEDWDGVGKASASLSEHGSSGEHHVSVVLSDSGVTGVLRLRMIPTGLTKAVALEDETEEIDVAVVGGYTSFIVGGFYSAIEATFTTALSAGTVTITVASNVTDDENLWPRTTVIDTDWDGAGTASKSMPDHAGFALHHVAIACSIQPSAGSILIRGRPAGSPGGHATLCGPYYLTGTGTVNVIITGFYDEFSIVASDAIVDAGAIQARVASVFGSPLVSQDFPLGGRLGVDVPATATAPGSPGDVAWDAGYVYVCVATDTWKRAALAAW